MVCTHNGAARLPAALHHLREQQASAPWEVVVVDNASTDGTAEVVATAGIANLRVVREERLGLGFARERGVDAAVYDVVTFVDDDNWLAPDWVQRAHAAMRSQPRVAALGGCLDAAPEVAPPAWFNQFEQHYAVGRQDPRTNHWLYGAGLVIRVAALDRLERLGWRPLLVGRRGSRLTSGEDVELCYALTLGGFELAVDDGLRGRHSIPAHRLRWDYLVDSQRGLGRASPILDVYTAAIAGAPPRPWPLALSRSVAAVARERARLHGRRPETCVGSERALVCAAMEGRVATLLRDRDTYEEARRIASTLAASGRPPGAPAPP